MMFDSVNKALYTSSDGVASYISTTLQPPEVSILVDYKDAFFGKKILDIGCGAGRTSHYFRNFTDQYIGVDYSEPMVDVCKDKYPDLVFMHCDARDLSCFSENEFDFVMFSYNGLDYISHDERLHVLKEIKRVLKTGGTFVFSSHNRHYNNIQMEPSLLLSLNPVRLIRNIFSYYQQLNNRRRLLPKEVTSEQYAIYNDSGNNFGLLTYYIDKESQTKQLSTAGFELLEMFQLNGQSLSADEDDSNSGWIYYVSKSI